MNNDLVSYSHGQIRIWIHLSLKIKYCHNVFDIKEVREFCKDLMVEIFNEKKIECETIGFDSNHFHTILDLGLWGVSDLIKVLKGVSGKKLLGKFPEIKKKYFWKSGFWSGTKYVYSVGRDKKDIERYVTKQKYFNFPNNQTTLLDF